MSKLRLLLSAAALLTSVMLPLVGTAGAHAHGGSDDPCPHRVENLPGCR